jgi:hypothetical protein
MRSRTTFHITARAALACCLAGLLPGADAVPKTPRAIELAAPRPARPISMRTADRALRALGAGTRGAHLYAARVAADGRQTVTLAMMRAETRLVPAVVQVSATVMLEAPQPEAVAPWPTPRSRVVPRRADPPEPAPLAFSLSLDEPQGLSARLREWDLAGAPQWGDTGLAFAYDWREESDESRVRLAHRARAGRLGSAMLGLGEGSTRLLAGTGIDPGTLLGRAELRGSGPFVVPASLGHPYFGIGRAATGSTVTVRLGAARLIGAGFTARGQDRAPLEGVGLGLDFGGGDDLAFSIDGGATSSAARAETAFAGFGLTWRIAPWLSAAGNAHAALTRRAGGASSVNAAWSLGIVADGLAERGDRLGLALVQPARDAAGMGTSRDRRLDLQAFYGVPLVGGLRADAGLALDGIAGLGEPVATGLVRLKTAF